MRIRQEHFIDGKWTETLQGEGFNKGKAQLVLLFGSPDTITQSDVAAHQKEQYPEAHLVFASTAGEILGSRVFDGSVVSTAIEFEKTKVRATSVALTDTRSSIETGKALMDSLKADDLAFVFVVSDGTMINGSELVAGINSVNDRNVPVTGGLAGDGAMFRQTFTGLNSDPSSGKVIAIGFYSQNLRIGHGTVGGWDEFGHERVITKSDKNILYEIDGKSALDLYKTYLGDYMNELPGSALLFPLSLKKEDSDRSLVRTILSINEADSSMVFAGNMPEGSKVRFMKANFTNLIDGSSKAAQLSFAELKQHDAELAILISCVGRKLVLHQRTEEETEAAGAIFGPGVAMTGFYSYGEISPFSSGTDCELHNQTMTITTLAEV